jgi:hypothetical protein
MKDIYVFICEDKELAQKLVKAHANKDQITYACIFREDQRNKITEYLDKVDAGE